MKLLFLILLTVTFAFSQKSMFSPDEAESLKQIYQNLKGDSWQINTWSGIESNKIYPNPAFLSISGIQSKLDRDTTINDETVSIYTIEKLDIGLVIGIPKTSYQKINGGTFPKCNFPNLKEFKIKNIENFDGFDNLSLPALKLLSIQNCKVQGEIELNSMQALEILDIFDTKLEINLQNLNLPFCRVLKIDASSFTSTLSIDNLQSLEILRIKEEDFSDYGKQAIGNFSILGTDINDLKKLTNAKEITIRYAQLNGTLDTLNFPNIEIFDLSHNFNIGGDFPVFNTPNIKYINLQFNNFTNFTNKIQSNTLEYLDVSYNKFSGALPTFELPNLKYLILNNNSFTTGFNKNIINDSLNYLKLNNNEFDQEIDFEINSEVLEYLNLDANNFKGNIPKINCKNAMYLSFASNQFNHFTNDLIVNKNTILSGIDFNLIPVLDYAERCLDFPESSKNNLDIMTSPKHILNNFYIEDVDKYMEYTGSDVIFEGINQIEFNTRFLHPLTIDSINNKLSLYIIDTANYNYEVIYTPNENGIPHKDLKIWETIKYNGHYQVKISSKYCSAIGYSEIININTLSILNKDLINIFKNNESIVIQNNSEELITSIQVIDLLGNILYQNNESITNTKTIAFPNSNQPLFIKLYSKNKWIVKKII